MVIIKKDEHDYVTFTNSSRVYKMSVTPASDNISTFLSGNGAVSNDNASLSTPSNNQNNNTITMTIRRDSSQQQLEKLQQYTQQQNQLMQQQQQQQQNQQLAKAQLNCRPNSHPFPSRTLLLEAGKPVKIGRAIARTKVSDNNGIFDCKVLSRNHAELWYEEGKFFLKDTGSSNGTFINNQRLSQTCQSSEPFEVSSGDIVQFGVDVMENSRKETHGCIVATLKLYLPDGREGKASQSTPQVDLYRLNQYIQEAIQREQSLENKLLNIQKKLDLLKKTSSLGWQALVDEDRLLSRIDHLEKKLLCFSKPLTEDKLREEIMKLQNEKMLYQTSAKQALKKVYNERMEAIQKLSSIENALCSTESECSMLRDELLKTQAKSHDTTEMLDSVQKQLENKVADYEEKMFKKEAELKTLSSELNEIQEKLGSNEDLSSLKNNFISNWLLKSDLKGLEGSEDIIKAICGDEDDESNIEKSLENNFSHIYSKMFALERELNSLFTAININNNFNNINNNHESNNGSESDINISSCDASLTSTTDNQTDTVPSSPKSIKSEETILNSNENQNENDNESLQQPQCDDNQNNMNNLLMSNALNISNSTEKIRVNLKQLLALFAKLKRLLAELSEAKTNEQSSHKTKCDKLLSQLTEMNSELMSRPSPEEFNFEVMKCDALRTELTKLTDQMKSNETLLEEMRADLNGERELRMKMIQKCLEERGIQTEVVVVEEAATSYEIIESTNQVPDVTHEDQEKIVIKENVTENNTSSAVLEESSSSPSQRDCETPVAAVSPSETNQVEDVLHLDFLKNHPKVLYEEEFVTLKEKCSHLSMDNLALQKEIHELKNNMSLYHRNWLNNLMMKYLVPVLILFVAYIFYLIK